MSTKFIFIPETAREFHDETRSAGSAKSAHLQYVWSPFLQHEDNGRRAEICGEQKLSDDEALQAGFPRIQRGWRRDLLEGVALLRKTVPKQETSY